MSGTSGPRADVDARLDRLRADAQRVDTAMADLDNDPGYRFLLGSGLAGETRTRWAKAQEAVAQLWGEVTDLHTVLDQAETIRNRRGQPKATDIAELDDLLTARTVVVARQDVPLAQRGLTGPATVVIKVSVAELIATMTAAYAGVVGLCAQAHAVLSAHASRLDELTDDLNELTQSAGSLGLAESGHPLIGALDSVTGALDHVRELVFTDPLVLTDPATGQPDTTRLDKAQADLTAARRELATLVAFRADADSGLARLGDELRTLADAETEANAAMRTVHSKISTVGLPDPASAAPGLADRLAALRANLAGPDWWRAAENAAALSAALASARQAAQRVSELATALLERRAELRGRLGAYQAKVGRLGLAEDTELAASHQLAASLLWTSPCDLATATKALATYQRLITERESTR
ncbi:MAG TPA: hypothetical protein VGM75_15625 [Pseudonocardiaceae bacterium]